MKTYYFEGYWQDTWECGDSCCSGGDEWIINFVRAEGDGEQFEDCWFTYSLTDVFIQVYEHEFGGFAPEWVCELEEEDCIKWLKELLSAYDIFVNVTLKEKE